MSIWALPCLSVAVHPYELRWAVCGFGAPLCAVSCPRASVRFGALQLVGARICEVSFASVGFRGLLCAAVRCCELPERFLEHP